MVMVLYVLLGVMGLAILTDVAGLTAQRLRAWGHDPRDPGSGFTAGRRQGVNRPADLGDARSPRYMRAAMHHTVYT
jgi:hypothetical protein